MVDRAILCLASRNNMLILATTIETLQLRFGRCADTVTVS